MNTFVINGITITAGRRISVINGRVVVDGNDVTPNEKVINITVTGNVDSIDVDVCQTITVTGSAGSVKTMSGDIKIGGDVSGSVKTMSGDVDCDGSIGGEVNTMSGDIKYHK